MRPSQFALPLVAAAGVFLCLQPVKAAGLFFAANGSGTACSLSTPCLLVTAISQATATPVELSCADSADILTGGTVNKSLTIDCSGTAASISGIEVNAAAQVTLKNFTMGGNTQNGIYFQGGTLVLENIHFIGALNFEIDALPSSPSTLIVRNCVFDHGGAAVVLKPSAGGSLSAVFDHVTITGNTGGGIKIDTTNGPVTVDITDSNISDNGGNGVNALGNAGGQNTVSIKNSVIAKNGAAGVQANGANAGVLISNTLLDQNAAGALAVVAGGNIFTYGNNQVIGSQGANFTNTAAFK
jgi:hypothetical protein